MRVTHFLEDLREGRGVELDELLLSFSQSCAKGTRTRIYLPVVCSDRFQTVGSLPRGR